jgi:hypothetical protein
MTTRSGGQPGFVGLARRTRQALGLPEFLPAHRTEVALHACRLLDGEWEAACADERLIDFVVGVVEAVDEFVAAAESSYTLPPDLVERAEAEAASWLVDFLADGGGAPDRDLLVKLSAPLPTGEDEQSIEALLFVLARQVSRALAQAMAARVGPLGRSTSSRT